MRECHAREHEREHRSAQAATMIITVIRRENGPSAQPAVKMPPKPTAADQMVSIQPLMPVVRCTIQAPAIASDMPAATIARRNKSIPLLALMRFCVAIRYLRTVF